jgi:hypothetical protein
VCRVDGIDINLMAAATPTGKRQRQNYAVLCAPSQRLPVSTVGCVCRVGGIDIDLMAPATPRGKRQRKIYLQFFVPPSPRLPVSRVGCVCRVGWY